MHKEFKTCKEDRPLIFQLCSNDPEEICEAASYIIDDVDAIDINLGCPQDGARNELFGAFLLKYPNKVRLLVESLVKKFEKPIFCKIRILKTLDETIEFCQMLEDAGCSLIAIHGRVIGAKRDGPAKLDWIKEARKYVGVPVISNGNT
eukprot:UN28673